MSFAQLYTKPEEPASFTGAQTFKTNHPGFKLAKLKKELRDVEAYSMHKQVKRKFPRRKTEVAGIDDQWQIDLLDISKLKYQNSHMTFLLTCIDVFRRFAWVIPIKNKEAETVRDAFLTIFKTNKPPRSIYSDGGNEFKGECKELFQKLNILTIETMSTLKAAVVERFNRTIREKIWRYITWSKSKRFIDVLPDLVKSYNATIHSSLGTSPDKITPQNEAQIRTKLYGHNNFELRNVHNIPTIKLAFKIGDYVRIVVDKKLFEKGATPNWSEEVYIVYQINPTSPPTFKIKKLTNEEYSWNYYTEELQKVSFKEFPYDTFKVISQKGDKAVVVKLNSENQKEVQVDKKILE